MQYGLNRGNRRGTRRTRSARQGQHHGRRPADRAAWTPRPSAGRAPTRRSPHAHQRGGPRRCGKGSSQPITNRRTSSARPRPAVDKEVPIGAADKPHKAKTTDARTRAGTKQPVARQLLRAGQTASPSFGRYRPQTDTHTGTANREQNTNRELDSQAEQAERRMQGGLPPAKAVSPCEHNRETQPWNRAHRGRKPR